jgi:hypothetical protein
MKEPLADALPVEEPLIDVPLMAALLPEFGIAVPLDAFGAAPEAALLFEFDIAPGAEPEAEFIPPVAPMPDEAAPMPEEPVSVLVPGRMEGDPAADEPVPVAVGRSVPPDAPGAVDCARAGAATSAVANRQATMWVLSIVVSRKVERAARTHREREGARGATAPTGRQGTSFL